VGDKRGLPAVSADALCDEARHGAAHRAHSSHCAEGRGARNGGATASAARCYVLSLPAAGTTRVRAVLSNACVNALLLRTVFQRVRWRQLTATPRTAHTRQFHLCVVPYTFISRHHSSAMTFPRGIVILLII
jgi:hypothetical protein